jgi:hypothetical protein
MSRASLACGLALDDLVMVVPGASQVQRLGHCRAGCPDGSGLQVQAACRASEADGTLVETHSHPWGLCQLGSQFGIAPRQRREGVLEGNVASQTSLQLSCLEGGAQMPLSFPHPSC